MTKVPIEEVEKNLAKMSPEDLIAYARSLVAFGKAAYKIHEDGKVTYVSLNEIKL